MYLQDYFYSFQGEGPFVGYPQLFIRFFGCNIKCNYCDTPDENKQRMTVDTLLDQLHPLLTNPIHSISITGGEPLLQVAALKKLLPKLTSHPLYLETNATLPQALTEVADYFSYFSIDYKLGYHTEFKDFLRVVKDKPGVFIKFVLLEHCPILELKRMGKIIADINANLPLIIQPVTPYGDVKNKVSSDEIIRAFSLLRQYLPDVRIIPQTHKFIGVK